MRRMHSVVWRGCVRCHGGRQKRLSVIVKRFAFGEPSHGSGTRSATTTYVNTSSSRDNTHAGACGDDAGRSTGTQTVNVVPASRLDLTVTLPP
jgi:hypothetical protein